MAGKKKQDKDNNWVSEIESYSRQIWLAGLGAYAKVGKEGVKLFENLIKDGEVAEKAAKSEIDKQVGTIKGKAGKSKKDSVAAAQSKVDKARGRVSGKWNELEEAFDKRLNSAVSRLGVPSRDEVKALNAKVDELTKLISELQSFPYEGRFVRYFTTTQLKVTTQAGDSPWPLTLDGEARCYDHFCAEVVPLALRVLLPEDCPLLTPSSKP